MTNNRNAMKMYPLVIVLAATLFVSCSRDEDATRGGGRRELAVNVQMQNSDWESRSGGGIANSLTDNAQVNLPGNMQENAHDRTQVLGSALLDEQLEIVTECEPIGYAPETPLTRGTPMGAASNLQSMGISVYTNSTFTRTITATNSGSSWMIANNIALDLDKNKYSYYAYAPVTTADNGIVLQADGKKLTYTAPTDITKQPDLCWAEPILDDKTGTATFAMQHALTAVGIKVRADNVEILSIKLLGVNTSGTLDLTTKTSAWTGHGEVKDLAFTLTNNKPATGNGLANITPSDGYLMLPPQPLNTDSKKLVIVYRYTSGTDLAEHTGTHQLSDITGNAWVAGQKVMYVIQLKAKFALDFKSSDGVSAPAGSYSLNYTTGSLGSSDPQVTCSDLGGWISNIKVYRNSGNGTITFDYARNLLKIARKASFTITSGFTIKSFELTQAKAEPITVLIAGMNWVTTNLTGLANTNTGQDVVDNPQDLGMFFRWGSTFVYGRISSLYDGAGWGSGSVNKTRGSSTIPTTTSSSGYDYVSLNGPTPGDPCQLLGKSYKTPTKDQWIALNATGAITGKYNNVMGLFAGPNANSCTNDAIQPGCIFLPAAGDRYWYNGILERVNEWGCYWTSSVNTVDYSKAYRFYALNHNSDGDTDYDFERSCCYSIRCIKE